MKSEFTKNIETMLPSLEEFEIDHCPFKVVDPSKLSLKVLPVFNVFMSGASVPHRTYVYSHDYNRFCMLVRQGDIQLLP